MSNNTNIQTLRNSDPDANSDSSHTTTSDSTLKNDPPSTDSPATIRGDDASSSPATIRGDDATSPATIRGDDASSPATVVGDGGKTFSRHSQDELLAAEALVELSRVERVFR